MKKSMKILTLSLFVFSLLFCLITESLAILRFTDYSGDQIRDAYASMDMWQNILPTLGPKSAWGEVYLPPLYFYLVFPFTIFSKDISLQAIFNGICNFATIFILIIFIYNLLISVSETKRIFLSILGSFWYACLFQNLIANTGNSLAGNAGSIPFFLLSFILLHKYQIKSNNLFDRILYALFSGLVLAILVSLHFTTLFVIPVVFIFNSLFLIIKERDIKFKWILPIVTAISTFIFLTSYWLGEIGRNWQNSQGILNLVFKTKNTGSQGRSLNILERLNAIFRCYTDLASQVYFPKSNEQVIIIAIVFILAVLVVGLIKFQGDKIIFSSLGFTWLLFLYVYSSKDLGIAYSLVFYKLIIYLAPLLFTIIVLGYLDWHLIRNKVFIVLIFMAIAFSVFKNLQLHENYINSKYGSMRIAHTGDLTTTLAQIPSGATFCNIYDNPVKTKIYQYIDFYITQKQLTFVNSCQSGNYTIYRKFEIDDNYQVKPNKPFNIFNKPYELVSENSVLYIYKIK